MDSVRDTARRGPGGVLGLARSAREYLAGLGTSGSLLAGAALMFIVASTMVAFHGWPHVAAQPSPGEVVVSARPAAATGSQIARRLAVIAAGPAVATGAPARAVAGGGGAGRVLAGRPGGPRRSIGASTSRPVPVAVGAPALPAGSAPAGSVAVGSSPGGSLAPAPLKPVQQAVGRVTGAVGGVVSGAGNQVGSTVQQATGAVGTVVQPVSPPAAAW